MGVIMTENNEDKGGEIDSCGLYLIRILIISLINIADLIISIIFFDPNCMSFFVFKFIMIFCIFLFYICLCCAYSYTISEYGCDAMLPVMYAFIPSIILLVLEIAFLVLFILNYSSLNLIVLIFYYIHWAPIIMIYILLFFRFKLYN